MIVNELKNQVGRAIYSKVITYEDDGEEMTYVFPSTKGFIEGIQKKRNAEKLHKILKNLR